MAKIGVVLSSGGGRGVFAHTGFMSALEELGIAISAAAGCSAGAVVGGVLASGTSVVEWLRTLLNAQPGDFWTPRPLWQLSYAFAFHQGRGVRGLSPTDAAIDFLRRNLHAETIEECAYPFAAIAVDLDTVDKKIFYAGSLAPIMMASAAMPGYYDPVEIDGRLYTDGAVFDLAPAEAICCRNELDVLLVHHVSQQDFSREGLRLAFVRPWTIVHIMHRLIFRRRPWYATGQPLSLHRCPCGCKALVVVVEPRLPDLAWPLTVGGRNVLDVAKTNAVVQLKPIVEDLQTAPEHLLDDQVPEPAR